MPAPDNSYRRAFALTHLQPVVVRRFELRPNGSGRRRAGITLTVQGRPGRPIRGGRLVWAELRIAGRELKADYTFSFPQPCVETTAMPVRVEAVAAPEATKAEGK